MNAIIMYLGIIFLILWILVTYYQIRRLQNNIKALWTAVALNGIMIGGMFSQDNKDDKK